MIAGALLWLFINPGLTAATAGFIRQYFQSAVMEYHPDTPSAPVQLRLLGDDLRDKNYPNAGWQSNPAFQPAAPLAATPPSLP